jgi:hypothetical protein
MNYKNIIAQLAKGAYEQGYITEKAYKQVLSALGIKSARTRAKKSTRTKGK